MTIVGASYSFLILDDLEAEKQARKKRAKRKRQNRKAKLKRQSRIS